MDKTMKPDKPCSACKTNNWWWREARYGKGEWVCGTCHPKPTGFDDKNRPIPPNPIGFVDED